MTAVAELNEQLPIAEARQGDPDAWSRLFRRYQLPLYAYAFDLVRQEQASLDVVQETFISAARHIGTLRDDARFGSWLFGIAHQKCAQHWRKLRPAEPLPDENSPDSLTDDADPRDLLIRQEQTAEFLRLVDQLPLPHRSVLLLHYLEEFPLDEIATITGTPVGTVKSRLHYAKRTLRKLISNSP